MATLTSAYATTSSTSSAAGYATVPYWDSPTFTASTTTSSSVYPGITGYGGVVTVYADVKIYGDDLCRYQSPSVPVPGPIATAQAPAEVLGGIPDDSSQKRAMKLLMDSLDDGQQRDFLLNDKFWVIGKDGYYYTVHKGKTYNVQRWSEDRRKVLEQLCFGPFKANVPDGDFYLTQKLILENEPEALVGANRRSNW